MKKSEDVFEIEITEGSLSKRLVIRPAHTTDGIPVYQCHLQDGSSVCELRRETSGEWVQLWGNLSDDSVNRIGDAIAHHTA
ncbi:hypothetical protein [Parapedobacter sp. 10938]|uniref:hypothetical protein n=1 Tax=Parapedobacter flavus TaxID=3110225 RepID=UPI002DBBE584|nr:hypothetical protein [Parapedobacter sp. 10938]MEC3881669.1 hypothetical protein [Parapedobacter sp. 10938]